MSIFDLANQNYGIIARKQALRHGIFRGRFDAAVQRGDLIRLTRSRYALSTADTKAVAAVRADGVISCASALSHRGVWVLQDRKTHLRRSANDRYRYPLAPNATDCRLPSPPPRVLSSTLIDDVPVALAALLTSHDDESAVVAMDSVLRLRLMSRHELESLAAGHTRRALALVNRVDGRVDSAMESLLRFRLESMRIRVRPQQVIARVGPVDMLVGRSLIIEFDGFEWHASTEAFRNDRRRDRNAARQGFTVIRITWSDLLHDWPAVQADILAIIRRGRHLRAPVGESRRG